MSNEATTTCQLQSASGKPPRTGKAGTRGTCATQTAPKTTPTERQVAAVTAIQVEYQELRLCRLYR